MDQAAKPSMEETLARYAEMRQEIISRLDAELGAKPWAATNGDDDLRRSGCHESKNASDGRATLSLFSFVGTYPEKDWKRSVDIVEEVAGVYGFGDTRSMVDKPGDLDVFSEDSYGGNYSFGMAKNTTLTIKTGCHRWDKVPPVEGPKNPED